MLGLKTDFVFLLEGGGGALASLQEGHDFFIEAVKLSVTLLFG